MRLEAVTTDEATTARVVAAAGDSFEYLLRIFGALCPLEEGTLKPLATSLNPEAGAHPVPTDLREIEAAVHAGEKCLQKIPYFEARYGERGRRFTSSDSAWLVTLSDLDDAQAIEQVFWLGRVLAARGMPRLTLQIHLELLFEELVNAVPARRERYATLQRAAGALLHLDNGDVAKPDLRRGVHLCALLWKLLVPDVRCGAPQMHSVAAGRD